ncbi:MAG: PAS domain S-box protein, partial [Sphingobacteriales bacterium]
MNNKLQQIESTKAIAALEQSLCLLMSNIEEAIIVVDKDLRIITFSSEFEKRYFDILEKKVQKGDSVLDYALSVKPNALIEIYNNVFAGETIKQEHETMVGDKYFAYSSIFKPIKDEYGNVVAAFVSSLNLTRQKLNESNIIAESRRYRALIENSFDGICLLGADGKLSYVTPSVSRILGYEMAEIIGINPANFCHPEDNDRIVGLLGALAPKYGETVTATYRMLHKNGSWRWLKANITNLLHEAGLHAFVFNYEDITEQKENEQQKQEIEAKSRAFFENSLDGMLLTVKEGTILAANPAACQMFGMTEEEICNAGRMGLIDISDPRVHKLIEERRLNGKAKGEITFIHKNGTKFPGEITSALFTNINGEERTAMIVRDMTDRVNAEQTKEMVLREKEALMNSTNDLMWSLTKDFKLIACNDAYIKTIKNLTGFTVKPGDDLLIGEPFSADYVSLWDNLYRNVMARNPLKEELYTPPFKNIPQGWAEVSLNPIYSNSEVIGIACYGRDITDMKLQQVALENLNKKLETAQSIARLGYWELDVASTNLTCSLETLNICGFKKNTPLNSGKFFNIIHPEDKEIYKKFRLEAIKNCRQTNIKIRIITPDNILKNVEIRVSANKDLTNCSEKLTGTIQDITEKFNAELQLAKSEQCLKKAQALAHIGSYESNFLTGIDIWSDELYRIFGLEPGELPASFNNFLSFIHPDDVEDFQKTVRQAEADLTMSSYSLRIVRKDGAVRMIYMEGRYVFDANGKPKSLFGTLQDITEHKEAEAENEKLAKLLQSSLNEIYVFNGETLRFEYVNNGALINLGYSKEEMLNKTTLDIKLEFTEQRYRALLNKLDENNEKIIYESFHKRADHSFYPVEVHLQRINVGGPIYKPLYMCVALDITERKVASAKIIESQTYLKTIFDNTKDGFILLNREGIIISHNAIAAETGFLSVDTEMKVGKNIFEFVRENRV